MDYGAEYAGMHAEEKRFPGYSICDYIKPIVALVAQHKPERMLDYGCGKGFQYLKRRVHERWGGLLPHCYDIGVRLLSDKPEGQFGGVICTDVLEHIERRDVPKILTELVGYTANGGFLFLVISCRPSRKRLSDKRDVHVTIERPQWWIDRIKHALPKNPVTGAPVIRLVAHFDVAGHFDEPDSVWDSGA